MSQREACEHISRGRHHRPFYLPLALSEYLPSSWILPLVYDILKGFLMIVMPTEPEIGPSCQVWPDCSCSHKSKNLRSTGRDCGSQSCLEHPCQRLRAATHVCAGFSGAQTSEAEDQLTLDWRLSLGCTKHKCWHQFQRTLLASAS